MPQGVKSRLDPQGFLTLKVSIVVAALVFRLRLVRKITIYAKFVQFRPALLMNKK